MCNRRNKTFCQGALLLALVGGLGYSMYLYSNISMDLEFSRSETDKYFRQQESLSSQLQVVYEHRARLERSLQKEKTDHKNTKLDSSRKQNEFMLNISRAKHEAMNRFNSLETQYNMLKAQNKELDTDYNRLRQQYTRLSSEHSQLNSELKRNFQLYKEQKTNEIASLDEEIKTLKQQVVQLRTHLKSKADEVEQYKSSSSRALRVNQQYQETIRTLEEKLTLYTEKLKKSQLERDQAVKGVKQDEGKTAGGRRQGGNSLDSSKVGVDDQEEKEKSQLEKGLKTDAGDNRHAVRDTAQERYHGQRYVPTTASIVTDSDQGDEDRQADNNKHKQDIYDNGYSHQRRDSDPNREESKRNENSQRENEQRQVLLRDSSENRGLEGRDTGVQVVAPTENSTNKWANIIKAAQQGNAPEEGKKEDNDKGEEKQGEEEGNEGKRSKRSVYDDMQEVTEPSRLQERNMQNYDQKQPGGEEKETDEWNGRPVVQRQGNSDVRIQDTGNQGENAQPTQAEQYEHKRETIDKEEEEDLNEQESDLSRKNINKQMAEMQESYNEKRTNEQQQEQEMQILPQERNSDARGRSVYRAPIPAVLRQDTAEQQADADNDDEDADTEQDTEEDPDDADEDDVLEPRDSPQEQQQQQHHQLLPPPQHLRPIQVQKQPREGRTFDRALKSANSNINYRPNE